MRISAISFNCHSVNFRQCQQPDNAIDRALLTSRKFKQNGLRNGSENLMSFVDGEIKEFKNAVINNDRDNMEEELGDVLFDTIMLADYYHINPTKALERTNTKINRRFNVMNAIIDKPLLEYTYPERLGLWDKAKEILGHND
ncbi:hypothetical protein IJI31_01745 [bacterium]|nr:hypothetical protein [bacterium]